MRIFTGQNLHILISQDVVEEEEDLQKVIDVTPECLSYTCNMIEEQLPVHKMLHIQAVAYGRGVEHITFLAKQAIKHGIFHDNQCGGLLIDDQYVVNLIQRL